MDMFGTALARMLATLTSTAGIVLCITFAVVLFVPTPESRPITIRQTSEALINPNQAQGFGLRYSTRSGPFGAHHDQDLKRQQLYEIILAGLLDVDATDVIVMGRQIEPVTQITVAGLPIESISPDAPEIAQAVEFGDASTIMIERIEEPILDGTDLSPARLSPGLAGARRSSSGLSFLADIEISTIQTAAVKTKDGHWSIVTRTEPLLGGWRLQILLAFLLSTCALIPFGWFAAKRLSQPLRDLERLANKSQLNQPLNADQITGSRELRSVAQALQNMHVRLSKEADRKSRFVAALAHALRTPLTSLRVRIETAVSKEQKEKMAADIARMELMSDEMMTYAKGQHAQSVKSEIELDEIITETLRELIFDKPISYQRLSNSIKVLGSRLALQRAITNLIENAEHYGSDTRVELSMEGGLAIIRISNQAPTLSQEDLDRLLAPFERGEQSRNRNTGGIGLGLAIASDIAKNHGGDLTLENHQSDRVAAVLRLPTISNKDDKNETIET